MGTRQSPRRPRLFQGAPQRSPPPLRRGRNGNVPSVTRGIGDVDRRRPRLPCELSRGHRHPVPPGHQVLDGSLARAPVGRAAMTSFVGRRESADLPGRPGRRAQPEGHVVSAGVGPWVAGITLAEQGRCRRSWCCVFRDGRWSERRRSRHGSRRGAHLSAEVVRREGVAPGGIAGLVAGAEPLLPLLRGAVRERVLVDPPAAEVLLDEVVADPRGGVERAGDVVGGDLLDERRTDSSGTVSAWLAQARRSSRPAAPADGAALRRSPCCTWAFVPSRFCTWWPYSCAMT